MAHKSITISDELYQQILIAEGPDGTYGELRIPLIEDTCVPTDFCYKNDDGTWEIDEAAVIFLRRRNFPI